MKTVKFVTLGCKVNQYETQLIRENFLSRGFKESCGKHAAVLLLNTCTVTRKADKESIYHIRRFRRDNPSSEIVVTGCLAEQDAGLLSKEAGVSMIVGNSRKERIAQLFSRRFPRLFSPAVSGRNNPFKKYISGFHGHSRAFLKVQDGCDNFCAYCKVPLVRGRSRSRILEEVAAEAALLAENGFKEIVLTGICLGDYGKDLKPKEDICSLIEKIEQIQGVCRIRLSSIEALDVTGKLIKAMSLSQKLCKHLHIPLQSGDDAVLKRMNRRYTARQYLELVRRLRSRVKDFALTTDVMAGFPGESDSEFCNTVELIAKAAPLKVHIFPYSRRDGTAAAGFSEGACSAQKIKERMCMLKQLSDRCSSDYRSAFAGRSKEVLIEGRLKGSACSWHGFTDNYMKVVIKSRKNLRNAMVTAKLKRVNEDHILAALN